MQEAHVVNSSRSGQARLLLKAGGYLRADFQIAIDAFVEVRRRSQC